MELKYKFLYLKVVGKFSLKFQFISKIIQEKRESIVVLEVKIPEVKIIFVKLLKQEVILGFREVQIHQLLI